MSAEGKHRVGGEGVRGASAPEFRAFDPRSGAPCGPAFPEATEAECERAMRLAAEAFPAFAAASRDVRARFLEAIVAELDRRGEDWLSAAAAETALPRARLEAERGRTLNQLRMFAGVLRDGDYLETRIDRAEPERKPLPKPDVRRMLRPLGPVVVFGASNFPLAFSVAGGDTASALAAGCPVVVKGHPGHPATSEIAAVAIDAAVAACRLPPGVFALLHGRTPETGARLVRDPRAAAVGFTGSLAGGRALFDLAAARPEPIPVYAEMGSLNPVFLLPRAVEMRGAKIAEGLAGSCLNSHGQLCTKPGLIVLRASPEGEELVADLRRRFLAADPGALLTPATVAGYARGAARVAGAGAAVASRAPLPSPAPSASPAGVAGAAPSPSPAPFTAAPILFETDAAAFLRRPELRDELFGPAAVVVRCRDDSDLLDVADRLPGALVAAVHHADPAEAVAYADLIERLLRRVGRLVFNGYPTGVEVASAMMHGGPYPATTAPGFTAVGPDAIRRWLRPVAFQDAPLAILPPELRG